MTQAQLLKLGFQKIFIDEDDTSPVFKIEIPVIKEDKFSKPGSIKSLIQSFQIPKQINLP